MRQKLVIGNWKMNGDRTRNAKLIASLAKGLHGHDSCRIVICPPFPYLLQVSDGLVNRHISLGAQNVSQYDQGAHTGEVCAAMLAEMGCAYVLLGHSERRQDNRESDAEIAQKFAMALAAGISPVLCVGESLAQRQADQTETVVAGQIRSVIDQLGIAALTGAIIAYEPVWAIGTGETATPQQAQAVHLAIRNLIREYDPAMAEQLPILYGGSVKADNAAALFQQDDIDGGLIGGTSLDAEAFIQICRATA
ncbi:triose-phosphate isomerase [Marinobacterium arenosum]|uniref:triose-phosphate isomerase n=1 Tax=Marinobacterium arenosum TaxID=2862496 RepID=UPI001C947AC7|nr:triose-phosphate isomerase [Marinobacterium arenosum]MBY4676733.1 triose-phosphate isomerase [Marinobacterium arenosum]